MKILQVLPALEMGGVERGTIEMAAAMKAAGIENAVVSQGGPLVRELDALGVRHYALEHIGSKNPFRIGGNVRSLGAILKDGFTLMHVRSRAPAWSVLKASERFGVPFIATFHGVYGTKPAWFKIPYNRVMTKGLKTIAVSDYVRRHVLSTYGVDEKDVVLIPRGADLGKFTLSMVDQSRVAELRRELGFPEGMRIVTLPGRLTRWKGQTVLLDALSRLGERNIGCLFVGSDQGRVEYTAELKGMAEKLPATMKVVFLPRSDEMPVVYAMSDIVVSASSGQPEAFGRVIPEAQAMERLVLGTAHGGACETISDGKTGFLVPPGDAEAMAAALKSMLDMDDDAKKRITSAARASVERDFSVARMCGRTIDLYREIDSLLPKAPVA